VGFNLRILRGCLLVYLTVLTHAKFKLSSAKARPRHPTRIEARGLLEGWKRLNSEDWLELNRLFVEHLDDTSSRVIVLKHVELESFHYYSLSSPLKAALCPRGRWLRSTNSTIFTREFLAKVHGKNSVHEISVY